MQQSLATVFSVVSFVVDGKVGSNCLRFRFSVKRTECPCTSLLRFRIFRKKQRIHYNPMLVSGFSTWKQPSTQDRIEWKVSSMADFHVTFHASLFSAAYFQGARISSRLSDVWRSGFIVNIFSLIFGIFKTILLNMAVTGHMKPLKFKSLKGYQSWVGSSLAPGINQLLLFC